MENKKRVSCIITTQNRECTTIAVDSALAQLDVHVEVIVVVDGGDKNIIQLLKSRFGDKIRVYYSEQKKGGNWARNKGISEANFEYVALLDDDDFWEPNKLILQIQDIKNRNPDNTVVFTSTQFFGGNEDTPIAPRVKYTSKIPIGDFLFISKKYGGFIQTSSLFASKKLFLQFPFDEKLKRQQDWDWILTVANAGVEFSQVDQALVHYRKSNKSKENSEWMWDYAYNWARTRARFKISKKAYMWLIFFLISCLPEERNSFSVQNQIIKENQVSLFNFDFLLWNTKRYVKKYLIKKS